MENLRAYLLALTARIGRGFPKRPPRYWLGAFAVLILSLVIEPWVEDLIAFDHLRNSLFQTLSVATMNRARPGAVKLLLIDDKDFWTDATLEHRQPTNRTYLAGIVRALTKLNASVIAIDFQIPVSERPGATADPGRYDLIEPSYQAETADLMGAVKDAASVHRVVLVRSLSRDARSLVADAVQIYGLCVRLTADGVWDNPGAPGFTLSPLQQRNISCGHVVVPKDAREIPPPGWVGQDGRIDSLSAAIARAVDPANMPDLSHRRYYATYVDPKVLSSKTTMLSGHELLDPHKEALASMLFQGNAVIVGAGWHDGRRADDPESVHDKHDTPAGAVPGVMIHLNSAAAVLERRLFPAIGTTWLYLINALLGTIAVIGFAAVTGWQWRVAALFGAAAILFALQWVTLNLFGIFLDAFIPVFSVGLHSIIERLVSRE